MHIVAPVISPEPVDVTEQTANDVDIQNTFLKKCKCGSFDHFRTTHKNCPMNKKNNSNIENLNINEKLPSCKCGGFDHARTNNSKCPLNKKYTNLDANERNKIMIRNKNKSYQTQKKDKNCEIYLDIAKKLEFLISDVIGQYVQIDSGRHLIPKRDKMCLFCQALVWTEEKTGSYNKNSVYSICCSKGKVQLPATKALPQTLLTMLDYPKYMGPIRHYNASFSFISFNATTDANLSKGNVYTLRIVGQIHHRIGPLVNPVGKKPQCAQIYFHDSENEDPRKGYSSQLCPFKLIEIRSMLDDVNNPFVLKFKYAASLLKKNPFTDLRIVILNNKQLDKRTYNKPTASEIAVLIPALGENDEPTQREGFVFEKNGDLKFIDPNHASYDPMQYVLLFPHGDLGWEHNTIKLNFNYSKNKSVMNNNEHVEDLNNLDDENVLQNQDLDNIADEQEDIALINEQDQLLEINEPQDEEPDFPDHNSKKKGVKHKMAFVTALQYYSYMLCDRSTSYIHRFGRLFHQYIVDQYSKIELARLNFFRHNQDQIRADLYQNIKDADPQLLGHNIGKRIVLPSTYKGSPRNMQQLYQDAMAVIRTFNKPDLFVTVTCNPHWPEIEAELKNVQNADKLTIIARVFKLKLNAIMDDLFKKHVLGKAAAHMYVIGKF